MLRSIWLAMALVGLAAHANAACSNPTAIAGEIIYSATHNMPAYCDGTNWIGMGGSSGGGGADNLGNHTASQALDLGNFNINNIGTAIGSAASFGGLTVTGQSSQTLISTSLIQVGTGAGASCSSGTKGAIRYSNTSSTLEYCNSTAWVSAGPSATAPVAFSAYKSGTQTVSAGINTKISFDSETFDTNNNFAVCTTNCNSGAQTGSESRFTPTIPGKYYVTANLICSAANGYCTVAIYRNGGMEVRQIGTRETTASAVGTVVSAFVDMNGTTDYLEMWGTNGGGGSVTGSSDSKFAAFLVGPQGSGGTATPAGATADVQFNSSGALAADTGAFTYSSGLLTSPRVSTTAISATLGQFSTVSLTTAGVNWGYLTNTNSYLPTVTGNLTSTTYASHTVVQVSGSTLTCAANTKGAIRYSNTSNTLEYCNSTTWVSAGPSDTVVPAFSAHRNNVNQTITTGMYVTLSLTTETYDTNNNFSTGTSRFTPTIPGKYLITFAVTCNSMASSQACLGAARKNGTIFSNIVNRSSAAQVTAAGSGIVDMNGTTDYVDLAGYTENPGGGINGAIPDTYLSGILISMAGAGTGASAIPAGSTGDVQFNNAGTFTADTGQLFWDATNNRLGIGTATPDKTLSVSASSTPADGLLVYGGAAPAVEVSATTGSGRMRLGVATANGHFISGAVAGDGVLRSDGKLYLTTNFPADIVLATSSTERMRVAASGYVGIGTDNPTSPLTISGTFGGINLTRSGGEPYIVFSNGTTGAAVGQVRGLSTGGVRFTDGGAFSEYGRFDADGNVGIGTPNPAVRFHVVSNTAAAAVARFQNGTGACTFTPAASGSGTWSCSSDQRLKKDISDTATTAVEYFAGLRIRDFTMRSDGSRQTGVIAQEVKQTHPSMVHKGQDGFYSVDEPNKWLLVKAVQEFKAANDNLVSTAVDLRAANETQDRRLEIQDQQIRDLTRQIKALQQPR